MRNILRVLLVTFLVALTYCDILKAQNIKKPTDTTVTFSLTIFDKKNSKHNTHFPDVYPDVSNLKLIHEADTIPCVYNFPFLKLSKGDFVKIKASSGKVTLSIEYQCINKNNIGRYLLLVPIRFSWNYDGAKFIVIEQYEKMKFFSTQSWGSTLFTGEKIKSKVIY